MAQALVRKVDTDWLLSIYGAMLTDKQRALAALYYQEDLSLAEIAQQEGVSRQCVHETLQRVEKQLHALEEKLHLRGRMESAQNALRDAQQALEALKTRDNAREIAALNEQMNRAIALMDGEEEANGL